MRPLPLMQRLIVVKTSHHFVACLWQSKMLLTLSGKAVSVCRMQGIPMRVRGWHGCRVCFGGGEGGGGRFQFLCPTVHSLLQAQAYLCGCECIHAFTEVCPCPAMSAHVLVLIVHVSACRCLVCIYAHDSTPTCNFERRSRGIVTLHELARLILPQQMGMVKNVVEAHMQHLSRKPVF